MLGYAKTQTQVCKKTEAEGIEPPKLLHSAAFKAVSSSIRATSIIIKKTALCQIRTDDPEITNHVLWPTELRRQINNTIIYVNYLEAKDFDASCFNELTTF